MISTNSKKGVAENPYRVSAKPVNMNRKHYLKKHIIAGFFAMMACVIQSLSVSAQTATIAGTNATGDYLYSPMYSINAAPRLLRSATLYPQAQLAAAGLVPGAVITSIDYHRTGGTNAMVGNPNLKLYMENRPISQIDLGAGALTWANIITPATLVYDSDPTTIAGTTAGWKTFPFGTGAGTASSFVYTGGALVVYGEWTQLTAQTATIQWTYQTPATATPATVGWSANSMKYTVVSTATNPQQSATITTSTGTHANIQFNYTAPVCTTPASAGIASMVTGPLCSGGYATMVVSGYSSGSGVSIQWQTYNGSAWVPAAGLTGAYVNATNITATTQFRAAVTCGASTVTSNAITASVVPTFTSTGTYTLNSALPTSGTNFNSIRDLDSALLCGITGPLTINVNAAGTYSGQLHLKNVGAVASPIIINGNNATFTYQGALDTDRACIRLDNADYVTINNLNITLASGAAFGFGIHLTNGSDNVNISGCTITGDIANTTTNYAGISISGALNSATTASSACDNVVINNNTIIGGYYGITLTGNTTTNILQNNQITNNTIRDFYLYGVYASYSNNMVIENNDIHRANRAAVSTFGPVYLTTGHTKALVNKNRIHDAATGNPSLSYTGYGVYISGSTASAGNENVISNNIIYNIQGIGTHYGFYNSASTYVRYLYNTVCSDYAASASGIDYGVFFTGATGNCEVRNNNISITRGGTGNKFGIYMSTATTVLPAVSDNNNFYVNSAAAGTSFVGFTNAGGNQATLANWQTLTSKDAASVSVDPIFAGPTVGNLRPTAATGLNNLGAPIAGITTDIDGATRNATTPDIGAFEWSPPVCIQPTGLNVTAITTTSATLGWTSVAGATGYEWMVTTSNVPPATGNPIGAVTTVPSGTLTPATFYYFHIRSNCGANGYSYWSTFQFATKPVNDDCANSINISNSLPTAGSTIGGTQTMPTCAAHLAGTPYANDVWYHFTTNAIGTVDVTATTTTGDVVLEVFSGTCGSFTSLGCVDVPAIGTEIITLPSLAPGTYYVRIHGFVGAQTTFTAQVLINGNPLSTNDVNISATNKGSYNLVNWNLTSDIRYSSFELERSGDGDRFTQLTTVAAGTSNEYVYNDVKPLSGMNYYRVKTVDRSGKVFYSKVAYTSVKDADLFTAEAYPNPVKEKFTVKVFGNQGDNAQVTVTDIAGKLVRQVPVTGNETIIDMSGMEQGIYFVRYQDNVHAEVMKITKQ